VRQIDQLIKLHASLLQQPPHVAHSQHFATLPEGNRYHIVLACV